MTDDDHDTELENVDPMVSIVEDGYYVGAWFLSGPGQDWFGVLFRNPEGVWQLNYRMRYYADPDQLDGFDPFDERDVKNNYSVVLRGKSEDEAIDLTDGVVKTLIGGGWCGTKLPWKVREHRHRLIVRGDGKKFLNAIMAAPFTHFSKVNPYKRKRPKIKKGRN